MFIYIAIVLVLVYLWIRRWFQIFERLGFPYVEPKFPFGSLGRYVGRTESMADFTMKVYEKYKNKGPAFGIFIVMKPILMITDPDLIRDILVKHFDSFYEHGVNFDLKSDPLIGHLFFIDGKPWKDLRAKLSPTFTSGKMKMMFQIFSETADKMIDYFMPFADGKTTLETKEVYASFTTEVIANVAFGLNIECHGNPDNEFRKMGTSFFYLSALENIKLFFLFSCPKIASKLGMKVHNQKTIDFFTKIVRDNLEYREKNNIQRNDFFQSLINIKNSDVGMTFEEIAANCFIFFLAGHETSSSFMAFCTYELALHQDIQDRLRAEIEEVIEKYNREITYDAIMEMKYLDMVFNETFRKYPIVDNQHRRTAKDFKIPNTNLIIPAGMHIMLPVVGLHGDERFYENPQKFDPERFTEENIKKRHPFTFIPFSKGPRICIGLRFGTIQSKLGLVKLLKNFRLLPSEKTPVPLKYSATAFMQCPEGGLWLKLEKINDLKN